MCIYIYIHIYVCIYIYIYEKCIIQAATYTYVYILYIYIYILHPKDSISEPFWGGFPKTLTTIVTISRSGMLFSNGTSKHGELGIKKHSTRVWYQQSKKTLFSKALLRSKLRIIQNLLAVWERRRLNNNETPPVPSSPSDPKPMLYFTIYGYFQK